MKFDSWEIVGYHHWIIYLSIVHILLASFRQLLLIWKFRFLKIQFCWHNQILGACYSRFIHALTPRLQSPAMQPRSWLARAGESKVARARQNKRPPLAERTTYYMQFSLSRLKKRRRRRQRSIQHIMRVPCLVKEYRSRGSRARSAT